MRSNGVNRYLENHGFYSSARAYSSTNGVHIDHPLHSGVVQLFKSLKQYDVTEVETGLDININPNSKKVCQDCGYHMFNVESEEVYTGKLSEYDTPELVTPPVKRTVRVFCKACGTKSNLSFYTLPPIG